MSLRARNKTGRSYTQVELVAGAILALALVLFVTLGGQVLPEVFRAVFADGAAAAPALAAAFILNIALVMFSWRRCAELRVQREGRLQAEARALELASNDFTTGLLNRGALTTAVERLLIERKRDLALLVIDLDHFKKVNDHYGHAAGDGLLRTVADLVRQQAPEGSLCGRLGGDEFAVIVRGDHASTEGAGQIAQAILDAIARPVAVEGGVAQIGASIGISWAARGDDNFGALLRRSDIAMYQAKKLGRNCFAWFDASMEAEVSRQNRLEAEMREGIPGGQFVPFYQPQFNIRSGRLHGFEVLARWNHPTRGLVEPDDFIALAEATGLIADLSMCVMRQALAEATHWDPALTIAVNVSPVQLKDPLFDQRIMKLLVETGFPAQRLEIEITESGLFENLETAMATIESLKALGITISLDDFGTGYSSLAQLRSLPFDRIKIDRSFVLSMTENKDSAAIVTAIATLGSSLHLPVTAEGIETSDILQQLSRVGCSEGQGWHYGRPLSAEQLRSQFPDALGESEAEVTVPALASESAPPADRRRTPRHNSWKQAS